jgi:hypothetical protein
MPGRRVPTRRNVSSAGGAAPAFGVLSVEPSTLVFSGVAGADAFVPEDIMQAYNSGAGPWSGAPSIGIAYDVTPDWLTLTPEAGVDGVIRYTITVDTTILAAGTEVATVTFTDALCSNSPRVATVTVVVEADDPTIGLSQSLFSASVPAGDVGVEQTVTITNVGGGVLATPTVGTVTGTGASYVGTPAITGSGPWTLTFTPDRDLCLCRGVPGGHPRCLCGREQHPAERDGGPYGDRSRERDHRAALVRAGSQVHRR